MKWLLILFGILANATASVLVKTAGGLDRGGGIVGLVTNWRLIVSLGCYGLAFLAYAAAVQMLPLNIAHPVTTAGAIVVVGLCSLFLFREPFDTMRTLGYGLLLLGMVALAFSDMGGKA